VDFADKPKPKKIEYKNKVKLNVEAKEAKIIFLMISLSITHLQPTLTYINRH
jgi:hypothetical protein